MTQPQEPDAPDAQVDTDDTGDATVAACEPPEYAEGDAPYHGALDELKE